MDLIDVNVLVYAHRADATNHQAYRSWLEDLIESGRPYGVADLVLSGFLRVVSHQAIFRPPSGIGQALEFVERIRDQPNFVPVQPGPRHWGIFTDLCRTIGDTGNLIPDVYLAAMAIETGSRWITTDRDFETIPGLRLLHPLSA